MMSEIPSPQSEHQARRYGVESMSAKDLSNLIARLEAEDVARQEDDPPVIDIESFDALNREIQDLLRRNPDKGRELCVAMAESENPDDRRLIAHNMVDLIETTRDEPYGNGDEELAFWWSANLLADPEHIVREAINIDFSDAIGNGRLQVNDLARIADELVALVDLARRNRPSQ